MNRNRQIISGREEHSTTTSRCRRVNRFVDGRSVERLAIGPCAEALDVKYAGVITPPICRRISLRRRNGYAVRNGEESQGDKYDCKHDPTLNPWFHPVLHLMFGNSTKLFSVYLCVISVSPW